MIKQFLCKILGHDCNTIVMESRLHNKHQVLGSYYECTRCGKKLSNWKKIHTDYEKRSAYSEN